jgi:hypothetical protein
MRSREIDKGKEISEKWRRIFFDLRNEDNTTGMMLELYSIFFLFKSVSTDYDMIRTI